MTEDVIILSFVILFLCAIIMLYAHSVLYLRASDKRVNKLLQAVADENERQRQHVQTAQTELMTSADKRLAMANEMVLKLAGSADKLSESLIHLKEMMVHLEEAYTSRNDMLVKNRDEYRQAYEALLKRYNELTADKDKLADDMFNTLRELAGRPTITNK